MTADTEPQSEDYRSVCIVVEPIFGPEVQWRAMAFVGGQTVNNIVGMDRTVVLDATLSAVAAAGVDVEVEALDVSR